LVALKGGLLVVILEAADLIGDDRHVEVLGVVPLDVGSEAPVVEGLGFSQ
jgi:hypothetical protein